MTTLIPKFDFKNGGATPTGAINRPINEKFSEYISVTDFGAVGDGTTDDAAAIQAAINAAGDRDVYFPAGAYGISTSIILPSNTGIRLFGEGNLTGTAASVISPLGANLTSATFACFTATGNLNNVTFERLRILGGGYGILVNLDVGFLDKLYVYGCVFQAIVTSCIAGKSVATPPPNGMYEIIVRDTAFQTSGSGIYCPGAFNVNRIEDCSFEIMNGSFLSLGNPSSFSTSSVHFLRNRCETIGATDTGQVCINLIGGGVMFNVNIEGNYFENVFQNVVTANGVRKLAINNNFHTYGGSPTVTGQINLTNCDIDFCNNQTLSGLTVNYAGTTNTPGLIYGNNGGISFSTLRNTTSVPPYPLVIPAAGVSLNAVPTIYSAQTNNVKFVSLTNNTAVNFFAFTGGSSSGTGYPSRACMGVRAIVLLDITDSNGVNFCATNEYLITATCFAGTTFSGTISTIVDQTSGKFTLTNSSASTTTYVVQGKYNTATGSTFAAGSRACILYEYIADEYTSSGISVS
jgi:hypothetical protein